MLFSICFFGAEPSIKNDEILRKCWDGLMARTSLNISSYPNLRGPTARICRGEAPRVGQVVLCYKNLERGAFSRCQMQVWLAQEWGSGLLQSVILLILLIQLKMWMVLQVHHKHAGVLLQFWRTNIAYFTWVQCGEVIFLINLILLQILFLACLVT